MKVNWNFQAVGEGGNPFRGGVMDIFWNFTYISKQKCV